MCVVRYTNAVPTAENPPATLAAQEIKMQTAFEATLGSGRPCSSANPTGGSMHAWRV